MPPVFSPLTEETISTPPKTFPPCRAFLMRQLGEPHAVDTAMVDIVREVFEARNHPCVDADGNIGGGDFLERILGLIRSTGFTIAVFSEHTRSTAFANIALELGFAAMCGKPLVIVKSKAAKAPSDLTRTGLDRVRSGRPGGVPTQAEPSGRSDRAGRRVRAHLARDGARSSKNGLRRSVRTCEQRMVALRRAAIRRCGTDHSGSSDGHCPRTRRHR